MKKNLLTLLSIMIFLFTHQLNAQEIKWNTSPSIGFVYQISNKEAQKLLTGTSSDIMYKNLLHTQIDSFNVLESWMHRPSQGHFILVKIVENKLVYEYTCVIPYQVFLFKEYDAFAIQVLDLDGNVRGDARVKLGFRRLPSDSESKTYRVENDWFGGTHKIVSVELNGFRSFFDITRFDIPSWYNHNYDDDSPSFYSYMITDKNKYKPGDLIRYKSYALNSFKSPIRKELEVWLYNYPNNIKIGTIEPHRPGSFAGEFRLHDSLRLTLDRNYNIQLRDKNGQTVATCSFKYEDYELFGNKLEIKLDKAKHYFPENNQLNITATDVNGLLLKDAKANILVIVNNIIETYQPVAILPDTLINTQIDLDPAKPTRFEIPTDLFQKTNANYKVTVTVINSENKRMSTNDMATFFYSNYDLVSYFSNDSICFDLLKNGEPVENIPAELRLNYDLTGQKVNFPVKLKLNPATILYTLKNDFIFRQVQLSYLSPDLQISGGIVQDSFKVHLKNPQQLDISYYIYQGSVLLKKGFGKELDYSSLIEDRTQTYYLELIYSLGGQEHSIKKQYAFKEEFLDVTLDIPEKVYPGQQVDATIHVKNPLGEPVKGVDLTAWAVTSKLNCQVPDLPYYGDYSTPRPKRAYYSKEDLNKESGTLNLDYKRWEQKLRLDTMKYYQFTYPWNKSFFYETTCDDSTQFAPFVMQGGAAKEVFVIEVDREPVYYSWAEQPRKYSFYISPCRKHQITLRLNNQIIILDSLSFEMDRKTILSIDLDHLPAGVQSFKLPNYFTDTEKNRHIQYLSRFQYISYSYAYLESGKEFIPLFNNYRPEYSRRYDFVAGPVRPGRKNYIDGLFLNTNYKHNGGYLYSFEENIVYKLNTSHLMPEIFDNSYYKPMDRINDRVLTKKIFLEALPDKAVSKNWYPRVVDIIAYDGRVKVFLPFDGQSSGIAAFVFEDCISKKTVSPFSDNYRNNRTDFYNIPIGFQNITALYSNGTYLKIDSILVRPYSNIVLDMRNSPFHQADSVSADWLIRHAWKTNTNFSFPLPERRETGYTIEQISSTGNVHGTVYDQSNEPIPGVAILIKGTNQGALTDLDGHFTLQIDNYIETISVMFVGYESQDIEVTMGSEVKVHMVEDIMALDEVVVVGYGVQKMYGCTGSIASVSSNYVEPKEDMEKQNISIVEKQESQKQLYQELLTLNSIRSNFSDVGFWEPRLYTDRKGESHFKVTFPDDITQWDATVYAMNRWLQTGTARKTIKSYKPLMTELHVPQFLTRGDTSLFLGKVLNYTSDSLIEGTMKWSSTGTDIEKKIRFTQYYVDKLPVIASTTDSITTSYTFRRGDGYFDGEERTVPVVEQGIVRADGSLSILKNGDTKAITAPEGEKTIVDITDNQLDIYNQEVSYLLHYMFDCNEQLASKLIGLLNYKTVCKYEGKPFLYDIHINQIIRRLLKNQNKEFLWSWWDLSNNTSYWISAHVLRALKCAKDAGYKVDLYIENIARKTSYKFEFLQQFTFYDIDLMHALATWGVTMNYPKYLHEMDSIIRAKEKEDETEYRLHHYYYQYSYLMEKLILQEIRQITGLSYQRDTLLKYRKDGIMGEVYFTDGKSNRYWYCNEMGANTVAYRIIKRDSLLKDLKVPLQLYFIQSRKNMGWNTYQSSNIVNEVLPDLLVDGFSKKQPTTIVLQGKENKTITEFPYHTELQSGEKLTIQKEYGLPAFIQEYRMERVTKAKTGVEGFEINTYFRDHIEQLKAGEPVELIVEVDVKKTSFTENVMIEIPIPGACSYADKHQPYYGVETHREYFKDRTVIFCENLKEGKYLFVVRLLPRFTGKYIINPAQVSLMYVPVVNANTDMKKVEVVER